ncbi:MAG: MFS transporter [Pseudomonadota bacterium]
MLAFVKNNFRWLLGGFVLTFFSSFGQTYFIAASVGDWQQQFGLSHGEFGRLYMLATLASAATLPFLGRIVDLTTELRVLLLVIPSLAAAALLAAFATNVLVLGVAIYLLRLFGQGMMTHTALTTTGRWFSASRGRAVSLVVLGHQGGEVTLLYSFAVLVAAEGYRTGWLTAAVLLILVALPLACWAYATPRTPVGQADEEQHDLGVQQRQWTRKEVLADPLFYLLLTGVLAPAFIGTTIFYHQDYLATLFSWSPAHFPRGIQVMAITTIVCALVSGWLIDKLGAYRVLPVFLLPLGLSCIALTLGGQGAGLFLVMFLLGISYGISSTLFGALWPETYGGEHLGAIRSVTVSAAVLSTAAGPGLTGTLIDIGIDLPQQMRFLGGYCFIVAVFMLFASRVLAARKQAMRSMT